MNIVEGQTFRDTTIDLDFTDWKKCSFINCTIHTTYGIFKLRNCDFTGCKLALAGVAETVARLLKLFFPDRPIHFEKYSFNEGKTQN